MQQGQDILQLVLNLLSLSKLPDDELIQKCMSDYPGFEALFGHIVAMRELSFALGKGDLSKHIPERGYIISNMKALQSTLRHLTWQTQRIADGDYSQKVEFLGEFSDSFNLMVAKLSSTTNQLVDLAHIDSLTRIPNRLSLVEFFEREFGIAKRNDTDLRVFMFDIDFFKKINDSYGHAAGDRVLIQFANILRKQFRFTDIFARYGGEEFVAVLPGTNHENALVIGERALESIESANFLIDGGKSLKVTVSIGITSIRPEDGSYEDLLRRCDQALYNAKNGGRNCMRFL